MKYILLDDIRSLQNVGAIMRSADGAGFTKVILTGITACPPRGEISKTALGREKFVDWEYYADPFEIVDQLKKEGFTILSVELAPNSIDYKELYKSNLDKVCLIMGNEVSGVKLDLMQKSDKIVEIPMKGKKNSLNVSVAASIVMYAL